MKILPTLPVGIVPLLFLLLSFLSTTTVAAAGYEHGIECTPCPEVDTNEICEIKVKVNIFAGETGYYEVEGCRGMSPTLIMTVGRTYMFDQSDASNWHHLIGFAYEVYKKEGYNDYPDLLEPGISPPGVDGGCESNATCPAPMYFRLGQYLGEYSNIPDLVPVTVDTENFGLYAAGPFFLHPFEEWFYGSVCGYGRKASVTYLNFDHSDFESDIFYLCHEYPGMSGRIKLVNQEGVKLSAQDKPDLPYTYSEISTFDFECGTYNLSDWRLDMSDKEGPGGVCPDTFLCSNSSLSDFGKCVEAMNCQTMASISTTMDEASNDNIPALFTYQMIVHDQNAVNKAKALLHIHSNDLACIYPVESQPSRLCPYYIDLFLNDIINVQTYEIKQLRDVLDSHDLEDYEFSNCDVNFADVGVGGSSETAPPAREELKEGAFTSAIECTPCDGGSIEEQCEVFVSVNYFAGEHGYYIFDGCEGVNPTLLLTVGRTYRFHQDDITNWNNLIGFAYYPDSRLARYDELERIIPPPDSGSNCYENHTCPAPIYYVKGEPQGIDNEDNGLAYVESLFDLPIFDWYGPFETGLNFDIPYEKDIFYFSLMRQGMTGRIKLIDTKGEKMNTGEDAPLLSYEYDVVKGQHDLECGTFGTAQFQLPNDQCPSTFVCNQDFYQESETNFVRCINSMNCALLDGMTANYNLAGHVDEREPYINDILLFVRQMIPHHQNAINMAKAILKSGEGACKACPGYDECSSIPVGCLLEPIAYSIINTRSRQIEYMKDFLESVLYIDGKEYISDCDVKIADQKPFVTPKPPSTASGGYSVSSAFDSAAVVFLVVMTLMD